MSELAALLYKLQSAYELLDAIAARIIELEEERDEDKERIAELEAYVAEIEAMVPVARLKTYRILTERAVKLQSPQKLTESYGGLIDLYYDAKKYAEAAKVCREVLELKTTDGKPRDVFLIEGKDKETNKKRPAG